MKKRLLALFLTGAMVCSMTACGGSNSTGTKTEDTTKTSGSQDAASTEAGSAGSVAIEDIWTKGTTVNFDVAAKAGGGTDLYTRYLTAALGEAYPGVNFVVTNYDTAEVGAEHAKNAKGDGLTLTIAACTSMDNYLTGASNVNPNEDYKVVGKMHDGGPQAIIAKPGAPYTNLEELGAYINEHPGEVTVGCALGGTSQIILYSIIDAITDGNADAVNYVQSASEADKLTNTASSAIDIANCSIPNAQAYETDGKLTILGTVGPEVATLDTMSELVGLDLGDSFKSTLEQGVDFSWDAGYYIMAPAETPEEICEALNAAVVKASEQDSFKEGMKKMASYQNVPDLAGARADWEAEWEFQNEITEKLGWKVR